MSDLKFCTSCGEGYVDFCRVSSPECPNFEVQVTKIDFVRAALRYKYCDDAGLAAWWYTDNLPEVSSLTLNQALIEFNIFMARQQGQL